MRRLWASLFALFLLLTNARAFDFNNLDSDKMLSGGTKLFKAAAGVSDPAEAKIGREVASNLAARYGLDEDPGRVLYLNKVGQAVVRHCGRTTIPYYFGILKTPEVNALAAPGGYIFVSQGLLAMLKNEAELAGVLAHEVSHVSQRHIVKEIRKANLIGAGVDLASAANETAAQLAQVSDFSIELLSKGLSRKDELEADKLGTQVAAQTGYAASGLQQVLLRLDSSASQSKALTHFNKTHPPIKDRLKVIEKVLPKEADAQERSLLAPRFAAFAAH
jgi:predicted Zn-dependent protease